MRRGTWIAPSGVVVTLAVVTSMVSPEQASDRLGVLLFVPAVADAAPGNSGDAELEVVVCRVATEGLEVTGHVTAVEGSHARIAVSPGDATGPGLRVGRSLAADVPLWPGAVVDDFRLVIPWATQKSRFVIVGDGSTGEVPRVSATGQPPPPAGCPVD